MNDEKMKSRVTSVERDIETVCMYVHVCVCMYVCVDEKMRSRVTSVVVDMETVCVCTCVCMYVCVCMWMRR